jgi:MFS family permease
METSGHTNKNLVLAAMIFAVSMTFIDMTIVAIAVPSLQDDLSLSSTGVQWIVNGYLLSLSALFAFGGRIADIAGHRSMVVLGVIVFATASALCGAAPTGSLDEAWIITFRVIQGAGAAIMFERLGLGQPDHLDLHRRRRRVLAGAGVGLVLSPANTDALNRVPANRYGEATGITQTVRNFGSSLGMAVLGTVLILQNKSNLESTATTHGVPKAAADEIADAISQGSGAGEAPAHVSGALAKVVDNIPHDFALATQTVFYAMAGVMALAFVVAVATMQPGKVEEQVAEVGDTGAA